MKTALMSRAKIALVAAISATILAIGIGLASTPVAAQAVTTSDGAYAVSLMPFEGEKMLGDIPVSVVLASDYDTDTGEILYYVVFEADDEEVYREVVGPNVEEALETPCQWIKLKNGVSFFNVGYAYGPEDFSPATKSEKYGEHGDGLGPQPCGVDFTETGIAKKLAKVSGNTMTVTCSHSNSIIFKFPSIQTVFYDYKFKFSTKLGRMTRDSSIATVKYNTTKWRTLKCKRTAYKSSTSSKKKFTIKAGSSVQVKKIYTYNTKVRYYVKTKSGKYGWISAGSLFYHGA